MLRALTSYIFGGMVDETPEAPIECETREVNDWLVVNLPDQIKDSITLNDDDDDTYEIDDDDIRNEMDDDDDAVELDASDINEMDQDEDDILLSVSLLMMPQDSEMLSTEFPNDQYNFESSVLEQRPYEFQIIPQNPSYFKYCGGLDRQLLSMETTSNLLDSSSIPHINHLNKIKEILLDMIIDRRIQQGAQRSEIVSEFEKKDKICAQKVHVIDISPPPMYSKSYVNHRHPEKVLNHDLLQRIKELEPEQQALQRSAKKILTRGQLNRQNKNYIYETSSKRNRRSNKQRNHSGANNNRKC